MILINRFDAGILHYINDLLGMTLPTYKFTKDKKNRNYVTPYDVYPEVSASKRLDALLNDFPNKPLILIHGKQIEHDYFEQQMFPSDWKRVPKLLASKRAVIWFVNPEEYIYVKPGFEVVAWKGNGVAKIIHSIADNMKHPNRPSLMDWHLMQWFRSQGLNKAQTQAKIAKYTNLYLDEEFKNRINIIFNGLDIPHLDLIREVRDYTTMDLYKMKLIYVLYFQAHPSLDMIRQFRGLTEGNYMEQTEIQHNPKEEAETFIEACRRFIKLKINIEDIYEDMEEEFFSSDFMDELFGYDEDEFVAKYEENIQAE